MHRMQWGDMHLEEQYETLLFLGHCWLWLSLRAMARGNGGLCVFIADVAGLLELRLTAPSSAHSPSLYHLLMMQTCSKFSLK